MSELTPEQIEDIAERVAAKNTANLLKLFGVDPDDMGHIRDVQQDFLYLRKARLGSEEAVTLIKRTALGVFVTTLLGIAIAAFKTWIVGG